MCTVYVYIHKSGAADPEGETKLQICANVIVFKMESNELGQKREIQKMQRFGANWNEFGGKRSEVFGGSFAHVTLT